jgi:hypothetical protein
MVPPELLAQLRPSSALSRLAWTLITALLAAFASGFGVRLGWELAGRAL